MNSKPWSCTGCPAFWSGLSYVPPRGPTNPPLGIALLGQGPGEREAHSGVPFIGPSGRRLSSWLRKSGLDESTLYIDNAVRCWLPARRHPTPSGNRAPTATELRFCFRAHALPNLLAIEKQQLALGRRATFIAVGIPAGTALLGRTAKASMAGSVFDLNWEALL